MSEFSSGILFLNRHTNTVQQVADTLSEPFFIERLNAKWSGFFAASTDLQHVPTPWTVALSQHVPLLVLDVAEDHGWSYHLLKNRQEVATLFVSYEIEWQMAEDIARARYPEHDRNLLHAILTEAIPFKAIQQEVAASDAYHQAVAQQYIAMNLPELAIFEISPDVIAELGQFLTADNYLNDMRGQEIRFRQLMNLSEFSWISYRYLAAREAE